MPGKTGERANPGAPQMARGRPERLTAVRGRITKAPAHGPRYGRRRLGNPMEERRWTGRPPERRTRCRPPPDAPRPPDIRIERQKKPNGRRSPPHAASPARAFSRPVPVRCCVAPGSSARATTRGGLRRRAPNPTLPRWARRFGRACHTPRRRAPEITITSSYCRQNRPPRAGLARPRHE